MSNLDDHGSPRPGLLPDGAGADGHGNGGQADADLERAGYTARADREVAAGRVPEPEPWVLDDVESCDLEPWDQEPWDLEHWDPQLDAPGLAWSASAGPAAAASAGPADPGRPLFAEDGAGDVMAPSPFLAALTEQAVADVATLSDNELVGVLRASQRLVAREQYKQVLAAAEFGRRRQATFQAALARGVPAGCAAGGFPGEELAAELVISRGEAGHLIDDSIDLTSRLPRTLAGMAAGLIDAGRAGWIAMYTRFLSPADTAQADEALAAEAPELQAQQLYRKASSLEKKLNPEAARARKQDGKREQRVEARPEASGNASLAGRELEVADVLAAKAYLDAVAARLREGGLPGSLDHLRAMAMIDLTSGRNPLDRIPPQPGHAGWSGHEGWSGHVDQDGPPAGSPGEPQDPARSGGPAPLPALINLIVPAGTLLGFSAAPAQAGAWGLLDRDDTRAAATAAAAHPATRWCVTLTGPDGTALAHGCARGPRPRLLSDLAPQPPPAQLAELLRRLNITFTLVARTSRDPAHAEDGYVPSRKLRHLVRARTATCDAPGCQNPAVNSDLDHGPTVTVPVTMSDDGLEERDGIEAKSVVLEQLALALEVIDRYDPARIATLGGECSVSVAPFAALARRYGEDLAVIWIDSHPDIGTPRSRYPGYHAMPVAALTGHGDADVQALLPATVSSGRVALAGLHAWTEDDFSNIAAWGIPSFGPGELRESSRPLLDWLAATGCSRAAIHFDVDTIDSNEIVLGLGAEPDGLSSAQARRLVADLDAAVDVVGFTIAEFIPRQVIHLQQILKAFPLIS